MRISAGHLPLVCLNNDFARAIHENAWILELRARSVKDSGSPAASPVSLQTGFLLAELAFSSLSATLARR